MIDILACNQRRLNQLSKAERRDPSRENKKTWLNIAAAAKRALLRDRCGNQK